MGPTKIIPDATLTELLAWCSKNIHHHNWAYCWDRSRDDVTVHEHIILTEIFDLNPFHASTFTNKSVITFSFHNKEDAVQFHLVWG